MTDLFTHAREHDLPPKWDGYPVEWEGWVQEPHAFICPPPKDLGACGECGSLERRLHSRGTRRIAYDDNVVRLGKGRLQHREMQATLSALRCPDCHHDTVVDLWTAEVWDLDPTDYGENGSHAPSPATAGHRSTNDPNGSTP